MYIATVQLHVDNLFVTEHFSAEYQFINNSINCLAARLLLFYSMIVLSLHSFCR